jgi:diguanylate cyclase (GGDEF)-like protein
MWFFHDYLHDSNRFLCPGLTALSLVEILTVMTLHFTGIADLRSTLLLSHIMMLLAVLYIVITLGSKIRAHAFHAEIRVSVIGILILSVALIGDLVCFYLGAHDVDAFGRLGFFIFILTLGWDASAATLRDIEAGRKAKIYKELAEKDMLTNCYNRNAYLNDTAECKLENGLLLVTFDLNNLKYYNDTFGHACGDQYLMDSVSIMQNVFGTLGRLYRVGGDEFCALIGPQHKANVDELQTAFLKEQALYNELPGGQIHLQIACGFAYYDSRTDANLEATLKRADVLMYENKRALKGCAPR